MRKQDYATLAELIALELKTYRPLSSGPARVDTLERLANDFAERASVNPGEFLRACTVEAREAKQRRYDDERAAGPSRESCEARARMSAAARRLLTD